MQHPDTEKFLPLFISKMKEAGLAQTVMDTFAYYYDKVLTGETGLLSDRDILPVHENEIENAENLKDYADAGKRAFKKSVRIVLNGGLGTSMGLTGPKSLIKIKNDKSFLEIILKQAEKRHVTLALMNSFSTHQDTLAALSAIHPAPFPEVFVQHKFPKIRQNDFTPARWPQAPELEWNPPGHGDVYTALYTSGMLQKLLDQGIVYAFISNVDNLGATMEETLLGYFAENRFPFMMEVAERTPADLKGGHLARHKNGRLILREVAQCPQNELDAFRDKGIYRFFNTNNIWVNLKFVKDLIETKGTVHLPMILNPKTLDPRDENSPKVYQVETAMGAAVSLFEGATAVKIPRSRFFPVKKCNDLLAVQSDGFVLSDNSHLVPNPNRRSGAIKINLDPAYYGKIDLFNERFTSGVPSLVDCASLVVEGDVFFERNVTVKGRVVISNSHKSQAVIAEGTVVEKDLYL
ncbi:MAG: UTP--glucose-1-phosphate uridylyltransferase [Deltaproteobacteria bacterium]|nr:UTP--glucose-1-phosphate uridylyltransferase [Deltaproteobacteria bacterium]